MATYYTTSNKYTISSTDTWTRWVSYESNLSSGNTSNIIMSEPVWNHWVDETTSTSCSNSQYVYHNPSPDILWYDWTTKAYKKVEQVKLTKEQAAILAEQRRVETERQEREYQAAQKAVREREQKLIKAEKVAKLLLGELIGPELLKKYEETGKLMFRGQTGTFILDKGGLHKFIKNDKITSLCIHLKEKQIYPPTDNMIALKTLLQADEGEFYKIANKTPMGNAPLQLPECAILQ